MSCSERKLTPSLIGHSSYMIEKLLNKAKNRKFMSEMPVEKPSITPGAELPAPLSLLASHPPRARVPSASMIRFPLTGSMGVKGGQRSATDQRAPSGRERELNPHSHLTFHIYPSYSHWSASSFINVFSYLILVVVH